MAFFPVAIVLVLVWDKLVAYRRCYLPCTWTLLFNLFRNIVLVVIEGCAVWVLFCKPMICCSSPDRWPISRLWSIFVWQSWTILIWLLTPKNLFVCVLVRMAKLVAAMYPLNQFRLTVVQSNIIFRHYYSEFIQINGRPKRVQGKILSLIQLSISQTISRKLIFDCVSNKVISYSCDNA